MTTIIGIIGILASMPAWYCFLRAASRIYRLISAGQPSPGRTNRPLRRALQTAKETLFHTELMRKPAVATAHWFVMFGFLIGAIVWFEAYIQTFHPAGGWPILSNLRLYHFLEEVLALGTVLGIMFLYGVRIATGAKDRVSRFYGSNARAAYFVEAIVLLEGLGMLLVKASKIATYGHASAWADFLTRHLAQLLPSSPLLVSIFALVKLLVGMVWLFIVARNLNWGVAWHRFLAFFNIFFQRNPDGTKALGALPPMTSGGKELTLETTEDEDTLGVGHLHEAPWKMLLDASTCTECGRCQEQCPAWNTAKPLSPKMLMTDFRDAAMLEQVDVLKLVGETNVIHPDVLWSCTNCGACVEQCPVDIEHIDHVANLRRYQVLSESEFPNELAGMFKNLETKGNPWGRNSQERASWIEEAKRDGIMVPVIGEDLTDFHDTEYLFWVGCAGVYDDAARRTTRAVVELLHTAGVKFAVLSTGETCTGDPARRAGNEFLFQQLASENIETLNDTFAGLPEGQRKIITTCPHCFNTIRNEYPDFGGHYDVFHHTQLLNRLVRDGHLKPVPRGPENRRPITYHDPCFLGRHNKIFDPPRELITAATGDNLVEMPRNKNEGFCCGAGGARMFMEEKLGTRINENRAAEAVATGAEEIAVGCPFCNTMMSNGVKAVDAGSGVTEDARAGAAEDARAGAAPVVKDVAQMLRDAILVDGKLPEPRTPQFLGTPKRRTRGAVDESGVAESRGAADAATVPVPAAPSAAVPPVAATPVTPVPSASSSKTTNVPTPTGVPTIPPVAATPTVPTPPTPTAPAVPVPPAPSATSLETTNVPTAVPASPTSEVPTVPVPPVPSASSSKTTNVPTPAAVPAVSPVAATPAIPVPPAPSASSSKTTDVPPPTFVPAVPASPPTEVPVVPVPPASSASSSKTTNVPTPAVPPVVEVPTAPVPPAPSATSSKTTEVPTPTGVPAIPPVAATPTVPTPPTPTAPAIPVPPAPSTSSSETTDIPTAVPAAPAIPPVAATPVVPVPSAPSAASSKTTDVPPPTFVPAVPASPPTEVPVVPVPPVSSTSSSETTGTPTVPVPPVPSAPSLETTGTPTVPVPPEPSAPSSETTNKPTAVPAAPVAAAPAVPVPPVPPATTPPRVPAPPPPPTPPTPPAPPLVLKQESERVEKIGEDPDAEK